MVTGSFFSVDAKYTIPYRNTQNIDNFVFNDDLVNLNLSSTLKLTYHNYVNNTKPPFNFYLINTRLSDQNP